MRWNTRATRRVATLAATCALVAIAAVAAPAPAGASPGPRGVRPLATAYAPVDWEGVWVGEIEADHGLDPAHLAMRSEGTAPGTSQWARARLRRLANESVTTAILEDRLGGGDPVERWRLLVSQYFAPEEVEWAMGRIACESTGDPYAENPRSSAAGLFQHLHRYWPERAEAAGWGGAPVWDPEANIAVAAWLYYEGGGAEHWTC